MMVRPLALPALRSSVLPLAPLLASRVPSVNEALVLLAPLALLACGSTLQLVSVFLAVRDTPAPLRIAIKKRSVALVRTPMKVKALAQRVLLVSPVLPQLVADLKLLVIDMPVSQVLMPELVLLLVHLALPETRVPPPLPRHL